MQGAGEEDRPFKRAKAYLATMEPAISGQGGHNATYRAACKLVGQFLLSESEALALLLSDYNPRCQPPWSEEELRHKVHSAMQHHTEDGHMANELPRNRMFGKPPGMNGSTPRPGKKEPDKPPLPVVEIQRGTWLQDTQFPPVQWAVQDLIPEGVSLLAGRPKTGKSWLMFQICQAVAGGWPLLGIDPSGGDVLYIALEDSYRRLQLGLNRMLGPGVRAPGRLHLSCLWPRNPKAASTSFKSGSTTTRRPVWWRSTRSPSSATPRRATTFTPRITKRSAACRPWPCKGRSAFQRSPTRASRKVRPKTRLTRCGADRTDRSRRAVLVLRRPRYSPEGDLFITGRDVEERQLRIKWDKHTCVWTRMPEGENNVLSSEQQQVLAIVEAAAQSGQSVSIIDVAQHMPHKNYDAVAQLLNRMKIGGLIEKAGYGRYKKPK